MAEERRLALIFAVADGGVIGDRGGLPWSYPEDRAHFFAATKGHVVVMGRRTWEERGSPLPGRVNVVVSSTFAPPRDPGVRPREAVRVARTLDDALREAWTLDDEPFVIGGARLFEEATPRATRVYLTKIPGVWPGDTRFVFDPRGFYLSDERLGREGLVFQIWERRRRLAPHAPPSK